MAEPNGAVTAAEPEYAKSKKKFTDYPWYNQNIDKYLLPEVQELFEKYSEITIDEQYDHVHKIRDKAFAIRTYPCTGLGVFLTPYISHSPAYWAIIERLKAGETLLDVGCFLGVDLRRMAFNGAPSARMYGVDIVSHWDLGFELFRDQSKFKANFIEADILSKDPQLEELKAKIDIISISAVLHQWDWQGQIKAAKRLVDFSLPGSIIVGHQIGNLTGKENFWKATQTRHFNHDPTTFSAFWDQVGKETGTKWKTEARLLTFEDMQWDPKDQASLPEGSRVLDFVVTRDD